MYFSLILTATSALLYAYALITPCLSWTILLFLVPLFYLEQRKKLSFALGFTWGLTFFFVHLLSIGYWVAMTYNYGLFLGLIFLIYLALLPAVWFWITQAITFKFSTLSITITWSLSFLFFILFQDNFYSFFLSVGQGYWLASPAIALVSFCRPILYWCGPLGSLCFIVAYNACISLLIFYRKTRVLIGTGITTILFIGIALLTPTLDPPVWLSRIGYIFPRQLHGETVFDQAYALKEVLYKHNPAHTTILMPESTLKTPLNAHPEFCQWWGQAWSQTLIMGAHRYANGQLFNTAFVVSNGTIIDHYDKQNPMAFIEEVPKKLRWTFLGNLLFQQKRSFCTGNRSQNLTIEGQKFHIKICSDFYMTRSMSTNNPILLLVSDDYAIPNSTSLFWHGALYHAIAHRVGILYIGHTKAAWISPNGNWYEIGL